MAALYDDDEQRAALARSVIALNKLPPVVFQRAAVGQPDAEELIARTVLTTAYPEETMRDAA